MVQSGMEGVRACRSHLGTSKKGLDRFHHRISSHVKDVGKCFVLEKPDLTAEEMLGWNAISGKTGPYDAAPVAFIAELHRLI